MRTICISGFVGFLIVIAVCILAYWYKNIDLFIMLSGGFGLISVFPLVIQAVLFGNVGFSITVYGPVPEDASPHKTKWMENIKEHSNFPLYIFIAGVPNFITALIVVMSPISQVTICRNLGIIQH
jgi:hypothetical protein